MRLSLGIAVALVAMLAAPVYAERTVTFAVSYEEVADNCPADGYSFAKGKVRIEGRAGNKQHAIAVIVPEAPEMKGVRGKAGKFRAAARGPSKVAGVEGKFSMAGRANRDGLQALFIVELFRDGKPLCTQSWSVTGKLEP